MNKQRQTRGFVILILWMLPLILAGQTETTTPAPTPPVDFRIAMQPAIDSLRQAIMMREIPLDWFDALLADSLFAIHPGMDTLFARSAEKKVDHTGEQTLDWYFQRYGVDLKVKLGKEFLLENRELLERVERVHGIHYEIIAGVLGMETNFAQARYKGRYYVFNALVSQYLYVPRRRNFALRELKSLYDLTCRTERPVWYFIGSYAGASGWGQFIPSSLDSYFVDANGNDFDLDIYTLDDNLFSIENYLYRAGLHAGNIDNPDSCYKAVFAYNHSDAYVRAVLYIHDALRAWRLSGFPADPPPIPAEAPAPDSLKPAEQVPR